MPSFSETCEMSPFGDHGEAVVLDGDEHAAGRDVAHGMVRAAVAERELERLVAEREPEQLVAEADAEERHAAEQRADRLDLLRRARPGRRGRSPISTTLRVGLEDRVGVPRRPGTTYASSPAAASRLRDRALRAEVDDDDARARRRPSTARSCRRCAVERAAVDGRLGERARAELLDRRVAERAAQDAAVADLPDERARVDAGRARRRPCSRSQRGEARAARRA